VGAQSISNEGFGPIKVQNLSVKKVTDTNYLVGFSLGNDNKPQYGLHYTISLVRTDFTGPIDRYFSIDFPDKFDLDQGQEIKKEEQINVPKNYSGKYRFAIEVGGISDYIAFNITDEIDLTGIGENIVMQDCYVGVDGDEKKYSLMEGIAIKNDEKLFWDCQVNNNGEEALFVPSMIFYRQSINADKIKEYNDENNNILLKASESKRIKYYLPLLSTLEPQAYSVIFRYLSNNEISSEDLIFHFVIGGESATIKEVGIGKSDFNKGSSVSIDFWVGSRADNFPQSRLGNNLLQGSKLIFLFVDENGEQCGIKSIDLMDDISKQIRGPISVILNRDCNSPKLNFSVVNTSGKKLDSFEAKVSDSTIEKKVVNNFTNDISANSQSNIMTLVIVVFVLLVVILGILLSLRKRK